MQNDKKSRHYVSILGLRGVSELRWIAILRSFIPIWALRAANGPWASARRWSRSKNKITIAFRAQRGKEEEERQKEGAYEL